MLPEIFGLIQCIIGYVIVFKHSQKVVWHRKWVLHPVVAPMRDQKICVKMPPKLSFGGLKNHFFSGEGAQPRPQTPPPLTTTSTYHPFSEILNTPLCRYVYSTDKKTYGVDVYRGRKRK